MACGHKNGFTVDPFWLHFFISVFKVSIYQQYYLYHVYIIYMYTSALIVLSHNDRGLGAMTVKKAP